MAGTPEISVVIATRNRQNQLNRLVADLQAQRSRVFELIVVDDGSPTAATVPASADLDTILIRTDHVERSRARNLGASRARAGRLMFLDDDMSLGVDFVEHHLAALAQWPGALVVGRIRLSDEIVRTPFGAFRQRLENEGIPVSSGPVASPNFCTAANMSIATARFRTLGGFDPGFVSGEDQDLALRHTADGSQIVYVAEAETVHHDNAITIASYCRRVEWGNQHLIPFIERHRSLPANRERERINGPYDRSLDLPRDLVRKLLKDLLAASPLRQLLLAAARLLESVAPRSSALDRVYRLLIGIHARRGFLRGSKRQRA